MTPRNVASVTLATVLVAACASDDTTEGEIGRVGYIKGFIGGVSADDPRAALVGRDILAAGGSAADAAVAMYFVLAVTKPSAASLGGGGTCVVHDPVEKVTEALEFYADAPAEIGAGATRPSAVPGNPRGFFALHAKYGVLRWEQLVSPAVNLARFGLPVTRAMAVDFALAGEMLSQDPEINRVFGRTGGGVVGEGDNLVQTDLSIMLGRMLRGPGDFYSGPNTSSFVDAVNAAGGSLTVEQLRQFRPRWTDTVKFPVGFNVAHVVPPPTLAGSTAGVMMHHLVADDRYAGANEENRAHLMAEVAMRAYGDRSRWLTDGNGSRLNAEELADETRYEDDMDDFRSGTHVRPDIIASRPVARPENPAGTSFYAMDRDGGAVACGLTMNNFFGTGRIAPGTGVVLATIPGDQGRGPMSIMPLIISNENSGAFFFAGAATGGVAAPTALVNVWSRAALLGEPLEHALAAPRVHHGGLPDLTYVENAANAGVKHSLRDKGHTVKDARMIGRVHAAYCPEGISQERRTGCEIANDPRSNGLAITSQE